MEKRSVVTKDLKVDFDPRIYIQQGKTLKNYNLFDGWRSRSTDLLYVDPRMDIQQGKTLKNWWFLGVFSEAVRFSEW